MHFTTQLWMVDDNARQVLLSNVDLIDEVSAGIIRQETLTDADGVKLRAITEQYRRYE